MGISVFIPGLRLECARFFTLVPNSSLEMRRTKLAGAAETMIAFFVMTAIARELDRRLSELDPQKAARCVQLVRDVLALLEEVKNTASRGAYVTRAHDSGIMPGIDST